MKKIAFSGTLDPITNGHMWVIEEARAMAEEVTVFLSENPSKKPQFPAEKRKQIIEQSAAECGWTNVQVIIVKGDYTARAAKKHGIDHLVHGLTEIRVWAANAGAGQRDVDAVKKAFWFHDAVYDHAQHEMSNEEASARLWIDSGLDTQGADGVADLIRATDHFQASSVEHMLKDVMLGADLAILGQDDEIYDAYAQAIRREYSHVPEVLYNEHRCKALVQLRQKAQANTLYFDAYFAAQYNDRAIANMAREIAGLGGGMV